MACALRAGVRSQPHHCSPHRALQEQINNIFSLLDADHDGRVTCEVPQTPEARASLHNLQDQVAVLRLQNFKSQDLD